MTSREQKIGAADATPVRSLHFAPFFAKIQENAVALGSKTKAH